MSERNSRESQSANDIEALIKERQDKREKASRAAKHIAALIFSDFDIEVTPDRVSSFIKTRWDRIAPLAHTVHEAPDMTKGEVK